MLRWKIEKGVQGGATFYQRDTSVSTWTASFSFSNTTDMLNADGDNIVINSGAISKTIAYSSVDLIDGVLPSGTFAGFWLQVQAILPKIVDTAYVDSKSEETYRRLYDAFSGATAPEGLDIIVELAALKVDKSSLIDDINITTPEAGGAKNVYTVNAVQGLKTWVNSTFEPVLLAQRKLNWDSAFSWGNHATAGYLLASTAALTYSTINDWLNHDNYLHNLDTQLQALSDNYDTHVSVSNTSAHSVSNITGLSTTLSNKANLVGGFLVEDEMPSWLTSEVKGRVYDNPDYFAKKIISSENKYLVQDMTSGVNVAYGYDTLEGWRISINNASSKSSVKVSGLYIDRVSGSETQLSLTTNSTKAVLASSTAIDFSVGNSNDYNFLLGTGSKFKINNNDIYGEFAAINHTHSIANITGLQATLDGKINLSGGTMSGALNIMQVNPYLTGDKLYVFGRTLLDGDVEISGNLIVGGDYGIPDANGATTGLLSNTDWSTFNGKQAALVSGTNIKTINGSSILGSGNLSVSSQWITNGSNIYYNAGNVGIGTTSPQGILTVQNLHVDGQTNEVFTLNDPINPHSFNITKYDRVVGGYWNSDIRFNLNQAGVINSTVMTLASSGNVGIGTLTPSEKLHVNGNIIYDKVYVSSGNDLSGYSNAPFYWNVIGVQETIPASTGCYISFQIRNSNGSVLKTVVVNGITLG